MDDGSAAGHFQRQKLWTVLADELPTAPRHPTYQDLLSPDPAVIRRPEMTRVPPSQVAAPALNAKPHGYNTRSSAQMHQPAVDPLATSETPEVADEVDADSQSSLPVGRR